MRDQTEKKLNTIRETIVAKREERARVDQAPVTIAEKLEIDERLIEDHASRWEPNAVYDGARSRLSLLPLPRKIAGAVLDRNWLEAAVNSALCKFVPDIVRTALRKAHEEEAKDQPQAMTRVDRAERLAELDAEILELEREEEALILEAASEGVELERRADADPRALLGLP